MQSRPAAAEPSRTVQSGTAKQHTHSAIAEVDVTQVIRATVDICQETKIAMDKYDFSSHVLS